MSDGNNRFDTSNGPQAPGKPARATGYWLSVAAGMLLGGAAILVGVSGGCQDTNRSPRVRPDGGAASRDEMNTENLNYAFLMLRTSQESQTADVLTVVVERLNQWIGQKDPIEGWTADTLLESLPAELRDMTAVKELDVLKFKGTDGAELQQTVWMNEVAKRARGEESQGVAAATNLFDWVVRNIQLERDGTIEVPHMPREILLLGRGTATDRAWIFSLLARQQGLDVVILALPGKEPADEPKLWLPALFLDGELYLFDTRLGLPIPGPEGKPVATLKEVQGDDSLLRQLDVDPQRLYPVKAEDLEKVTVLVEGSPACLSERMRMVELELPGKETLTLTARPSALAERVKSHPHVDTVQLWRLPYERLRAMTTLGSDAQQKYAVEFAAFKQAALAQGRIMHLLGLFDGEKSANALYQAARPSDEEMKSHIDRAPPQERAKATAEVAYLKAAKQSSSYWLGLVAFERGNYPAAIDYLKTRTLAATPDGPWTPGARYNLGRALEAQGDTAEAIRFYQADLSAQRNGNLLRAQRLAGKQEKPPQDP